MKLTATLISSPKHRQGPCQSLSSHSQGWLLDHEAAKGFARPVAFVQRVWSTSLAWPMDCQAGRSPKFALDMSDSPFAPGECQQDETVSPSVALIR